MNTHELVHKLVLRKALLADSQQILSLFSSPEFAHAGIRELTPTQLKAFEDHGFLFKFDSAEGLLVLEEVDAPLGIVGVVKVQASTRNLLCTIVGGVDAKYCEQGFGKVLAKKSLEFLFGHFPFQRVEVNILADNTRSIRLHESLGFQLEGIKRKAWFHGGELKDQYVMSLLREEHSQLGARV